MRSVTLVNKEKWKEREVIGFPSVNAYIAVTMLRLEPLGHLSYIRLIIDQKPSK